MMVTNAMMIPKFITMELYVTLTNTTTMRGSTFPQSTTLIWIYLFFMMCGSVVVAPYMSLAGPVM